MDFIKHFNHSGNNGGNKMLGSAILIDGKLTIKLPNTFVVEESGFIEGGFGVVTKTVPPRKSHYTMIQVKVDLDDLPAELRGQTYKYRIYAEQIADNEFVFPFKRAKMLNHK